MPLQKEPKLARARAIPEWEEYDSEIARFARKLAGEGLIRSDAAAVDVNVLANVGTSPLVDTKEKANEAELEKTMTPRSGPGSHEPDEL
jgi:UDP-glucose:glycoprotein glucosyltransferase